MITEVRKWGNSLGIRVPKALAQQVEVSEGTRVALKARAGRIVVTPVFPRRYRLEDLVSKITRKNRHAEVETGKPRGREVW